MKTRLSIFLFAWLLLCVHSSAQINDLSQSDMEALKEQAKNKVDQFNDYISYIASKRRYKNAADQAEDSRNKDLAIVEACKLFIGEGKQSKDNYGNIIPAPIMQTSVKKRNGSIVMREDIIPEYLRKMKNKKYTELVVKSSEAHFTSDAKKVGPDEYEMTLSYAQIYIGKMGEVTVYTDKTRKTIKVYVKRYIVDGRTRWHVLLGSVKVDATE